MDRRRFLLTSLAGALGAPLVVGAQQGRKVFRIGVLGDEPLETYAKRRPEVRALADAFINGLRDHGWIENENFTFVRRYAEGKVERYPLAAAELVALVS
jgi:putative tryptophan/tyrosine transport system substrate-binding protein